MSTDKVKSGCFFSSRLAQLRGERSRAEFARFIGVSAPLYFKVADLQAAADRRAAGMG